MFFQQRGNGRWHFTADTHFGHANIIKHCDRPFRDVEHMESEMIELWNNQVGKNDDVIILGDFVWNPKDLERITSALNGYKILVPGNHDACHPRHKQAAKYKALYESFGIFVSEPVVRKTYKQINLELIACHFPFESSMVDDRYPEFHVSKQDNAILLHGHVHEKWQVKDKMINVGVDVWNYYPVSETEISLICGDIHYERTKTSYSSGYSRRLEAQAAKRNDDARDSQQARSG